MLNACCASRALFGALIAQLRTMAEDLGANGRPHAQDELLRWVAELYYLRQQGQADIATLIGASVSKVSRLLAEARRQGIVTIQVAASRVGDSDLERLLARQLGLQAVFVAPARVAD